MTRRNRWLGGFSLLLTLLLTLLPVNASAALILEVFVRDGCPHCTAAKAFLPELQRAHPQLRVQLRSLNHDPTALQALLNHSQRAGIAAPGVPTFVLGDQVLVGFDDAQGVGRQLHPWCNVRRGAMGRFGPDRSA